MSASTARNPVTGFRSKRTGPKNEYLEGPANYLPLKRTPDGWVIIEVRGQAHIPGYDIGEVGEGLDESTFRREVLGDWSAAGGKIVYPQFNKDLHVAKAPLPFDPSLPLICGWDFGGSPISGTPAFVPTQLQDNGQWFIYPEIVGPMGKAIGIYEFTEEVADYVRMRFARPYGLELEDLDIHHFGDPAGNTRPSKKEVDSTDRVELRSSYEIIERGMEIQEGIDENGRPKVRYLAGWGWQIEPGYPGISARLEAVRLRLMVLVNGAPAILVDPDAELLIEGFGGGYHYPERNDGTFEDKPAKNYYSHPHDALQYPATMLFTRRRNAADEDDEEQPTEEFISQAIAAR